MNRSVVRKPFTLFYLLCFFWFFALPVNAATEVEKSPNDTREYRYLYLENRMKVLLISDPETEKEAVSLDINIGSGDDPADRPGLAHFLEHMLFLGTAKFPEAGEYQDFINSHGGTHNAYTSLEHTNYFFDVQAGNLSPALDRFSQFFVAPLFNEDFVNRERNAVHSEYMARIKDEFRRTQDVYREIYHPDNKIARFSVGNLTTLDNSDGEQLRQDLLAFFEQHYSANVMALAVLGKQPLDELEALVSGYFSGVSNRKVQLARETRPLFREGFLPAKVSVQALQEQYYARLTFPVPDFELLYRNKPVDYIAYLLGHEGAGSLLSLLKSKGWAEALSAGPSVSTRESAAFAVSIRLTQEGYRHVDEVVDHVFQAIRHLERSAMDKWRYNEMSVVRSLEFRYQDKTEPVHYVSALANNMHYYSPADTIRGAYRMDKFVDRMIRNYFRYLVPDNMLLEINAPDISGDRESHYYQTVYQLASLPEAMLERWRNPEVDKALAPPQPNEYIAKQLKIKSLTDRYRGNSGQPRLVKSEKNHRLWFLQDEKFNVPKGGMQLYLLSDTSARSSRHAALTEMYVRMVNDQLNEQAYAASLAGMNLTLARRTRGLEVGISGYSDKQSLLLNRIIDVLVKPSFKADRFDNIRQQWMDELQNAKKKTSYIQLFRQLPPILAKSSWPDDELLKHAASITREELQAYAINWLRGLTVDTLIYGNFTETDALKLSVVIEHKLKLMGQKRYRPYAGVVSLPQLVSRYPVDVDHPDPAALLYIQGEHESEQEQVLMQLLAQIINAPFYHELRTRQQLGYIVFADYYPVSRVPGAVFLVQSPTVSSPALEQHISDYLKAYEQTLEQMSDPVFSQHVSALRGTIAEEPKNLFEQGQALWRELGLDYQSFDRKQKLLDALDQVDKPALLDFYRRAVTGKQARWLNLSTGNESTADAANRIQDLQEFKARHMAFPSL